MDESSDETGRYSLANFSLADHLALWIGCAALLAGIVVIAVVRGTAREAVGISLLGLCGVAWFFLALLLIGEGEERDRRSGRD